MAGVVPRTPSPDFPIAGDSPSLGSDQLSRLCHHRGQKQNQVFPYSSFMLQPLALCSLAKWPLQNMHHPYVVTAQRTGRGACAWPKHPLITTLGTGSWPGQIFCMTQNSCCYADEERYNFLVLCQSCLASLKIKYMLKVNENFHDVWVVWYLACQHHIHTGKNYMFFIFPKTSLQTVHEFF